MRKLLFTSLVLLASCTTYPKFKYKAVDNKGIPLTIHEYKGTYESHTHDIGDTVVIYTQHGHFGLIHPEKYDGGRLNGRLKNVIITQKK